MRADGTGVVWRVIVIWRQLGGYLNAQVRDVSFFRSSISRAAARPRVGSHRLERDDLESVAVDGWTAIAVV